MYGIRQRSVATSKDSIPCEVEVYWEEDAPVRGHSHRSLLIMIMELYLSTLIPSPHLRSIWDIETGHERSKMEGHADWVTGVAISSDGNVAVSCSEDNSIR